MYKLEIHESAVILAFVPHATEKRGWGRTWEEMSNGLDGQSGQTEQH